MPPSFTSLDPVRLQLPEKPALEGLEAKWMPRWEEAGVYRFDPTGLMNPRGGFRREAENLRFGLPALRLEL